MSSTFFHKPELALRRALELEGIHQDAAALSLLHDVLSSRRHRTWSPAYENIMIAYLDLCLKMHKSREAKDGLHQYRNLSQSQAPGSLEKVIRYLMEKAEAKCTAAKAFVDAETLAASAAAAEAAAANADDEGAGGGDGDEGGGGGFGASPQAILLSTMSTDPAKSQRDSAVLLPSLKFLWEIYRAVLDILRSNSKLEHVYHAGAQGALAFCRTYKRRMEFRHLCDMLRMHLGNLRQYGSSVAEAGGGAGSADESKSNSKVRGWEGWTTDSIELHLQTRFAQLETASVLHRYTEGFRTVEDIYNILQISHNRRKTNPDAPPPKAKLMAAYYEKLTTLFWVSENYLFHAFAWYKYYTLCIEYNRGMSPEMRRMQASAVLLAALCIPSTGAAGKGGGAGGPGAGGAEEDHHRHGITSTLEDDIVKQKMGRMATLLGFHTRNPSREALLQEIRSKHLLDEVPAYLRDLYYLLEENSDPLCMVERARPLLDMLRAEMGSSTTTDSEEDNDDVKDKTLGRYVQPLTSVLLLKLLVNLSAAYYTVSMDHLKKLTQGLDMTFEQVEKAIVLFTQTKTLSVRIDHRAGCLRFGDAQLESDVMRSQLVVLSKQLESVCRILQPVDTNKAAAGAAATNKLYDDIRSNVQLEHRAIMDRKNLIEKRKEEAERLAQERVREEKRIKAEEEAARKAEEERRIQREQRLREADKQRKIQQEIDNKAKKRFLDALGKDTEAMSDEQMAQIDTEALQKEHQEKQNKKREDAERKTREAAKKLDYLVRAIRIEELPLIQRKYAEGTQKDRERYEQDVVVKVKKAREQWEKDVKDKEALAEHNVFTYFGDFERSVMAGRRVKHRDACAQADRKAEVEAERAKIRRARQRKRDEIKRKEEEAKRQKQLEAEEKAAEEKRKKEQARKEKEAREEEARQQEMKRMEDERRKRESARTPPNVASSSSRGSGGGGGGGGGGGRYVPPSRRNQGGGDGGGGGGGRRFDGGGGRYPGGGRYERGDGGGGGGWRDRGGGGGGYGDRDRGGGGYGDRDRGGGGGYGDRDRGGGGYGDRDRDRGYGDRDRGGYNDRRGGGGGGGGGASRGGDRGGPPSENKRWR